MAPPFIAARIKALMTHMGRGRHDLGRLARHAFWRMRLRCLGSSIRSNEGFGLDLTPCTKRLLLGKPKDYRWMSFPLRARLPQCTGFDLEGTDGFPDEDAVRTYLLNEADVRSFHSVLLVTRRTRVVPLFGRRGKCR